MLTSRLNCAGLENDLVVTTEVLEINSVAWKSGRCCDLDSQGHLVTHVGNSELEVPMYARPCVAP